jgi:hypothetical protein
LISICVYGCCGAEQRGAIGLLDDLAACITHTVGDAAHQVGRG